jgi:hypothetical protein
MPESICLQIQSALGICFISIASDTSAYQEVHGFKTTRAHQFDRD